DLAREIRRRQPEGFRLLLFVDQIEELLTASEPDEADRAAEALARLLSAAPWTRLLATCRVDYLPRFARWSGVGEQLWRAVYVLGPLSRAGLRDAISGPAEATGARFESAELVETLVSAGLQTDGALPLLQFALSELWSARDAERGVITERALEQMG